MSKLYDQHIAEIYSQQFETHKTVLPFGIYGRPLLYQNLYLPEPKDSNILDAGCGNGIYALNLVKKGYFNVYGVDLFQKSQAEGFVYQNASLDALPFSDNYFDFIYAFSVIYYLSDIKAGIKELNRVLKPGKHLIITAHTRYSIPTLIRLIKRFFGFSKHLSQVQFHSSSFYLNLFKNNGFEIIHTDGYLLFPFLYRVFLYFRKLVLVLFKIDLGDLNKITSNKLIARIKSEIAYHSIIIVKKKDE